MGFLSSRSLEFLIYKVRVIISPSQGSMRICVCVLSHIQLFETPVDYSPPGSSVHRILWARILELSCSTPGDLPDPGIEPMSLVSPALQVDSLPLHHLGTVP